MKTTRQTSLGEQLDMFGAPEPARAKRQRPETEDERSARQVREEMRATCPRHSDRYVCVVCLPRAHTDGLGFIHRQDAGGKLPLRTCQQCGELKTPGHWNHSDYWRCLACVPLGTKKVSPIA